MKKYLLVNTSIDWLDRSFIETYMTISIERDSTDTFYAVYKDKAWQYTDGEGDYWGWFETAEDMFLDIAACHKGARLYVQSDQETDRMIIQSVGDTVKNIGFFDQNRMAENVASLMEENDNFAAMIQQAVNLYRNVEQ